VIAANLVNKRVDFCFRNASDSNYTGQGTLLALKMTSDGRWIFLVWDDNGRVAQCHVGDVLKFGGAAK
jgi:hypothetical protein